jgi:hypothetical protein
MMQANTFAALTTVNKAFLAIVVLEFLAVLGLTIERLATIPLPLNTITSRADFTYALVLIFNGAFCVYYAFHGVLREQKMEVYVFIIASVLLTIYVIYQFAESDSYVGYSDNWYDVLLSRLVVVCVLVPPSIILGFLSARDFGWVAFRTVGGDAVLGDAFQIYSLFLGMLKVDLQVGFTVVMMLGFNNIVDDTAELVTTIVGLVLTIIWALIAWASVRYERKALVVVVCLFAWCEPAYLIWKLVLLHSSDTLADYVKGPAILACAAGFIVRVFLLLFFVQAVRNFGKGLTERFIVRHITTSTSESQSLLR